MKSSELFHPPHPFPAAGIGARCLADNVCSFVVWAKNASTVDLRLLGASERIIPLASIGYGYFYAEVENVQSGARYFYRLNGTTERPDPASRFQPDGVHGPSQIIDSSFSWRDENWRGLPLHKY